MGKIGADLGWSRLSFLSSPLWRGYGAFRVKADTTRVEWPAPEVRHVSHTYAQNVIHVVFSTKDRRKSISPDFQPKVWAYSAGICEKHGIFVQAIGGVEDHGHFLIQLPPVMALAKAVASIQSNSSRWGDVERDKLAW